MLADAFGWGAAALMVATFSCRDPLWMRPLAVCTNVAFIGYACSAGLAPVLALHALLLPINAVRWWQSQRIVPTREPAANASVWCGGKCPCAVAPGATALRTAVQPMARIRIEYQLIKEGAMNHLRRAVPVGMLLVLVILVACGGAR